jgi:Domain of unknown function (DUF4956)
MSQQLQDLIAGSGAMSMQQIGLGPFILLMAISLVCSFVVSLLYVQFYASRATGSQVHRAFPLLGISITAIFVCIQFSLPLSLGLLGALSIVRFRTPIKEPEEVGFIMLVIAVSIATATFKLAFVGLLLVVALGALLLQARGGRLARRHGDGTLVVTVPDAGAPARAGAITEAVGRHIAGARLESLARQDGSLVMSYAFRNLASPALDQLQSDLPALAPGLTFSLYFSRPDAS